MRRASWVAKIAKQKCRPTPFGFRANSTLNPSNTFLKSLETIDNELIEAFATDFTARTWLIWFFGLEKWSPNLRTHEIFTSERFADWIGSDDAERRKSRFGSFASSSCFSSFNRFSPTPAMLLVLLPYMVIFELGARSCDRWRSRCWRRRILDVRNGKFFA